MAENTKHVVSHIDFNGDSIDIKDAVAREAASDAAKAVSELTKNVVTDIAQGISDYTIRVTKNGLAIDVPIKGLSSKLDELTEAIGGSGGSGGNISLDSSEFTGIPKAPTAASGSDTTQIANTKFVQSELAARSTKVEKSSTNGNIKINGTETIVYTHPGSGTNPHGTTKSDVGLGNVGNFKAVSTVASQGLTDAEKSNARANIGAGTSSFSGSYNDLSNKPTIPTKVGALANDKDYATKTEVTEAIDSIEIGERDLIPNIASNWQAGNWDEFSGNYSNSNGRICTKVGLKVSPRETYSIKIYLNGVTGKHLLFRTYGSDGSFIGSVVGITNRIYTVPSNVYELRFVLYENVTLYDLTNGAVRVNVEKVNNSIIDLSMLGWSVPEDCPIQNEVNGNQFIQKVGRVDLGSLNWKYDTITGHERFRTVDTDTSYIKPVQTNNALAKVYSNIYVVNSANGTYSHVNDKSVAIDPSSIIWVYDTSYTDATTFKTAMQGQYLYYELANYNTITIDGNDITKVTRDSLRRAFAMVLQDTWLFHGTIYENIAYGKPDATLEDVKRVCKAARIHNYIMRLPKQYDTVLTDDGRNISKGQKQLLTIARAMLLDAHMLILDEATSNVDTRTELQIQEAMLELMKDKTCFVIAHRLSTIQNADCILVVKEGEVIEQGTHDELMEKRGFYRSLYDSQFAGKQI